MVHGMTNFALACLFLAACSVGSPYGSTAGVANHVTNGNSGSASGGGGGSGSSSGGGNGCGNPAPGCLSCGVHTDGAGDSVCLPPASTVSYVALVGGTDGVSPGTLAGYTLSPTALKTYRFRWTGDNIVTGVGYREFYGSLWTTGHFTSVTPGCINQVCPLEAGDFVSTAYAVPGGERIDWDTFASDGWDGFSFTTDTEPVFFDVFVDGQARPDLYLFPSALNEGTPLSPASTPFGMSSSTTATDGG
jgi:hypothetical protein